ncbi:hypothetical protein Vadar_018298 [Vaccinium darrowii]|uniref:Uncharacterized protein n=1 Tax=Vaccinium darrowii TaxID=229202 RepID=A0ACB7Y028_9ERIC|nr:hypothetical protein Vadar_018298 [Vaccinium darrowii]
MILQLLKTMLPLDAKLPNDCYEAKKIIKDLGLNYEKIHACPNDCMQFWKGHANDDFYECGASRWVTNDVDSEPNSSTSSKKVKRKAAKVLRWLPVKPRLQRLYMTLETTEAIQWHSKGRTKDPKMRHPTDTPVWKSFDSQYEDFTAEPRNVRLGLASDGFNPYGNMSTSYSIWPVILIPYNLLPSMCMKPNNFILSLVILGPRAPTKDIDVYLQPLVDELKELWEVGVETYDLKQRKIIGMKSRDAHILMQQLLPIALRGSLPQKFLSPLIEMMISLQGESKKRGISRLVDVWNLPPTKRIVVEFNQVFVPVGKEGGLFNQFLGTIARKPHLCPISYQSWHEVPWHYKEDCWNITQLKFVIPKTNPAREGIKHKTLKTLGVRLRYWRFTLKNKQFDEAKTPAQIVAKAPPMALSLKNREDMDWTENKHTTGSKSFAQHAHEMVPELGFLVNFELAMYFVLRNHLKYGMVIKQVAKSRFAPSRAQLYKPTHTRADGTAISESAAANMDKMEDLIKSQPNSIEHTSKGSIFWSPNDVYSQVITKIERPGRCRGYGFGPTSKSSNSTSNDSRSFNVADEEERMRDKETIRKLEETVQAQTSEMQAQAKLMPGVTGTGYDISLT